MKTRWLLMLGGMFFLLSLAAAIGYAAGTGAGTAITNQAQVQYRAGSDTRTATSNTTTLYVAHRVAGAFFPASGASSGVDFRTVYFTTKFTNQGNRTDNFNITFNTNAGYTVDMLHDVNTIGTFDGDSPITSTGSLTPDAEINLLVRVQIAATRPDNENVTITATFTSTAGNDAGNHIVVANPGAAFQYGATYTVNRPVIAFSATQSAVLTNATRIPGAPITYSLSLQNTGSGPVSGNSTVTFHLDPSFHYVSSTSGGVLSGPDGNGNGGTVTWTFAQASLAATGPLNSFNVVVTPEQVTNNGTGVPAGTNVTALTTGSGTQTRVQFNDGVNTYSQDNANSFTFAVGKSSGTVITQVTADGSGEPGSTVEYQYTLKNTGNATDGFDLAQANDATGDLDIAHVFSQTPGGASVGSLAGVGQGATVNFYVRVALPATATNTQTIKRTLSAVTQTASPDAPIGGTTSSSDGLLTTVHAASVTILVDAPEVVTGALNGNPVPGTVLRYTITVTNAGSAPALNVKAWDVNAHLTTDQVVPSSVNVDADGNGTYELSGIALPYNSGGIQADLTGGVLTTQFASIPGSSSVKYQYEVTIQ
jgi:uncharacterized repeat protein (TIGR01451 family)